MILKMKNMFVLAVLLPLVGSTLFVEARLGDGDGNGNGNGAGDLDDEDSTVRVNNDEGCCQIVDDCLPFPCVQRRMWFLLSSFILQKPVWYQCRCQLTTAHSTLSASTFQLHPSIPPSSLSHTHTLPQTKQYCAMPPATPRLANVN